MDAASALDFAALRERALPDGGFSGRAGGGYRPDATAWAALALTERAGSSELVPAARARVAADQLDDGRVPVAAAHPNASWPTALAILAWRDAPAQREPQRRAIEFLLGFSGVHWPAAPDAPFGHDSSIRGWPWIQATHSWVEPTSLAILALGSAGRGDHARVGEGVRMLLDRQLPRGGWNYGNTTVLGKELLPFPDSTGLALAALAGHVQRRDVAPSLALLAEELPRVRTPLAIGWGLLGLGAWGELPPRAEAWVRETLARPGARETYDTSHLALLLLAQLATLERRNPFSPRGVPRAS